MSILLSNEIVRAVEKELKSASQSVQIISAYCKKKTLEHLEGCVSKNVKDKKIMLRFRLDDIIRGSTDFEVLDYAICSGWQVYIRFDLHAKTYIVDEKRGIVGSANVTSSGLGVGKIGNMEMGTLVNIEIDDINKINQLYKDALFVNEHIYTLLKNQYEHLENKASDSSIYVWNNEIVNLFIPCVKTLFSYELPEKDEFYDGEFVDFLDQICTGNSCDMKDNFRWSNVYLWLLAKLEENNGCMYFGELSAKLHESMVSDPKPYRKDVKILLSNTLALIEKYEMDEVIVDRPHYSQRIRLRRKIS